MNLLQLQFIIQRLHRKGFVKSLDSRASVVYTWLRMLASSPTARYTIANNCVVLSYHMLANYALWSRQRFPINGATIFQCIQSPNGPPVNGGERWAV